MTTPRDLRIGDHIAHVPSGDYLGTVTMLGKALVHFDGPRTRDGQPITVAGYDEVQKVAAPPN